MHAAALCSRVLHKRTSLHPTLSGRAQRVYTRHAAAPELEAELYNARVQETR